LYLFTNVQENPIRNLFARKKFQPALPQALLVNIRLYLGSSRKFKKKYIKWLFFTYFLYFALTFEWYILNDYKQF